MPRRSRRACAHPCSKAALSTHHFTLQVSPQPARAIPADCCWPHRILSVERMPSCRALETAHILLPCMPFLAACPPARLLPGKEALPSDPPLVRACYPFPIRTPSHRCACAPVSSIVTAITCLNDLPLKLTSRRWRARIRGLVGIQEVGRAGSAGGGSGWDGGWRGRRWALRPHAPV